MLGDRLRAPFLSAVALAVASAAVSPSASAIPLPFSTFPGDPDAGWKTGLRNVLLTLNPTMNPAVDKAGFTMPTDMNGWPIGIERSDVAFGAFGPFTPAEQESIERAWLLERESGPYWRQLNIPDEVFTLPYIEGAWGQTLHSVNTNVHVVQPITDDAAAAGYGFLYAFDYGTFLPTSANPHYGDPGTLHRAMTVIALELIMYDQMHKTKDNADPTRYVLANEVTGPTTYAAEMVPTICWRPGNGLGPHPGEYKYNPAAPGPTPPACAHTTLENIRNQSYYFALTMDDLAQEYLYIRPGMTPAEREPYDEAFLRMGNRLANWGPAALHFNRTLPGCNALFVIQHIWQGLASQHPAEAAQALQDYYDYTRAVLDPITGAFDRGGFFPDDYGWDASYNRINFTHVGRLARQEAVLGPTAMQPLVLAALSDMWFARSHMTAIDPDGVGGFPYAPSHFSSRTPGDYAWGQGLQTSTAFDALSFGIDGAYAEVHGWDPADYDMLNYTGAVNYLNGGLTAEVHTAVQSAIQSPNPWQATSGPYQGVQGWQDFGYDYYRPATSAMLVQPGDFAQWAADLQTPETDLYPHQRTGDGFELIDDDFVWVKLGDMTTLLYTGQTSAYEDPYNGQQNVRHLPAGFGGGMISMLTDTQGGGMMLSRRRTRYQSGGGSAMQSEHMDNWRLFDRWSLHDLWLQAPGGGLTQSARILTPLVTVQTTGGPVPTQVDVAVKGQVPTSNLAWGSVLTGPVDYSRSFTATHNSLDVRTTAVATNPNGEPLTQLVETLPLNGLGYRFQGRRLRQANLPWEDIAVTLHFQGGATVNALLNEDVWFRDVLAVTYERLGGSMTVTFKRPARVKLTPPYHHWYSYDPLFEDGVLTNPNDPSSAPSESLYKTRNLVIDLLGNAGTGTVKPLVKAQSWYTITVP